MTATCTAALFWHKDPMTPNRLARLYYIKFKRLRGCPHALAKGTAIGTFIGFVPVSPFKSILIICITLLSRSSTIAGILTATVICNPLTYFPLYYIAIVIGNTITPYKINWERIKAVLEILEAKPGFNEGMQALGSIGYEATIVLLLGGTILALPFTFASYFLSLTFFLKVREKRQQKQVLS